jgi:cell wall-associated NlpC family hydrolase
MAAKAAKAGTYTVVRGDTLSRIAARHCGHAAAYPALAAASGVADPNLIFPGQRITLACAGAAVTTAAKTPAKPAPVLASGSAGAVVAYARAQVGKAYVWGTAGPSTFDCSGLVMAAYAHIGIKLPHQSESILAYGRSVSRANLAPGDILWPYHGHVSIYIGDGKVVEAATPSQGVKVSTIYAFMTARRLV